MILVPSTVCVFDFRRLSRVAGTNAAGLLGGDNPLYEINITNSEAGSCLNSTGGTGALNLGTFNSANTTTRLACPILQFSNTNDTIRIDVKLRIPYNSKTGTISDTITATFSQI